MSTIQKYNNDFIGEDFTIVQLGEVKQTKQHRYYREIFFDKHPNPYYRDKDIAIPPVREFHKDEDSFVNLYVGQTLHNVAIHASMMYIKMPGRYYSLVSFDNNILEK